MIFARIIACLMAAAAWAGALAPAAAAADFVRTERAATRLVAEHDGFAPGETVWFALAQEIAPGWHVYWKNPGDSGLPLELVWALPEGFAAGEVSYPAPHRLPLGPLVNFGHEGEAVFLVPVTAPADAAPGSTAAISLTATWLICADICVPETGEFALDLPVVAESRRVRREGELFRAARSQLPERWPQYAAFDASSAEVVLRAPSPSVAFDAAHYFPNTDGAIKPAGEQRVERSDGSFTLSMVPGRLAPESLDTLDGVLVFEAGDERYAYEVSPSREVGLARAGAAPSTGQRAQAAPLILLLALAFAGGLILNVMPCVFPVIFIKAASLAHAAQVSTGAMRRQGLFYTLGVVAAFFVLGILLLAARAGGEALGWGFHLQSPIVVLVSAYVLFLVGLNLAGVFSIGHSLQGAGEGLARKPGDAGAFATGALAVVVAAPCIGPLLTAPLGAAIVLPPAPALGIFMAMALGLAAPWLALSYVPQLAGALPRPGPWMNRLRQALSFPVFAAAAFFLWVLAAQTGQPGLARALAGAILIAGAAWLFEAGKGENGRAMAARIVSALLALAAGLVVAGVKPLPPAEAVVGDYSKARVAELQAAGSPVFVEFTAAWCVTCQFNRLTVLETDRVRSAFTENGVVKLTADWTARDPEITTALQSFGASGVPLYVYYPPSGDAVVLSQPLSERALIETIGG